MSGKYRLLLAFWCALFFASALILFLSLQSLNSGGGRNLPLFPQNGTEINGSDDKPELDFPADEPETQWSLILSTISVLVSSAGFMATTYFAMRNDRRQTALTELEIQKLANQIEQQRLEIDQMRRELGDQ
jgi:heme/copper-type cytochrome/quinol oxidase subunit 3